MKNNKFLTAILALTLMAGTPLFTGCKNKVQTEVDTTNASIKLSFNALSLCVGDTALLGATISGGNANTYLEYKCADESIATINEYGFIQALKPGTTEIRAIYGSAIAKCSVAVDLKDNVPSIEIKNIADKSIQIDKSTRFEFKPVIKFNNSEYDFDHIYFVSNPEVAEMDGDTFVPKANGVVYVTIEGKFFSTQAVSTTIEIIVKDNVVIYMADEKGIERNDIYLYSVGQIDDESFTTSFAPSKFGVLLNGEEIQNPNLTIDFVNDNNVVAFNPTTYEINSTTSIGTAQYVVTYVDEASNSYVKTFDVYNNKSVFTYKGDVIETDSVGSLLPVDDIFADFSSKTIIKATSIDGETEYQVKDGKVIGLPVIRDNVTGDVEDGTYIVYNDTVGFKVKLRTYTKIVKEASDLDFFNLTSLTDKLDGYYVLNNNINGGGYEVMAHTRTMGNAYNYYPSIGLLGVFDGRGHTIENISLGEGGLFGNIGNGGTVKNLAIKDVDFRRESGRDDTPVLACYLNGAVLENVYISNDYISANYNAGLVANNIMASCSFKHCYFELQIADADMSKIVTKNYGVFGSLCGERNGLSTNFSATFYNVVVNSNIPLIHSETNTRDNATGETIKFICDVENHPFVIENDFIEYILVSDITRYYTNDEMKNSGNNFENFNRDYWHVDSGMLCWGQN